MNLSLPHSVKAVQSRSLVALGGELSYCFVLHTVSGEQTVSELAEPACFIQWVLALQVECVTQTLSAVAVKSFCIHSDALQLVTLLQTLFDVARSPVLFGDMNSHVSCRPLLLFWWHVVSWAHCRSLVAVGCLRSYCRPTSQAVRVWHCRLVEFEGFCFSYWSVEHAVHSLHLSPVPHHEPVQTHALSRVMEGLETSAACL